MKSLAFDFLEKDRPASEARVFRKILDEEHNLGA